MPGRKDPQRKSSKRPIGQPTRGKTAQNRLRRVDTWLLLYEPSLLRQTREDTAWFVDLGYGAEPFTTLESAERLRQINPCLRVLGVEIDPERVDNAQPYADALTLFRLGGFNLPMEEGESVRAIRAFNVLRQYEEAQVEEIHSLLMQQILPGGLLVEGTSDPFGRVWVANVLRRNDMRQDPVLYRREGLVFSTNFHSGFDPAMFQPVLPKNFIHRMLPGEKIYQFFESWKTCARETIALRSLGLRQWFSASAIALKQNGYDIDLRTKFIRRGFLIWKWKDT